MMVRMVKTAMIMVRMVRTLVVKKERKKEKGKEGQSADELPIQLLFIPIMLHSLVNLIATPIIFLNISNIVKLQKILEEFLFAFL